MSSNNLNKSLGYLIMRSRYIGYLIAARLSVNIVSGSYTVGSSNTLKEEPLGVGEGINQIMLKKSVFQENMSFFFFLKNAVHHMLFTITM